MSTQSQRDDRGNKATGDQVAPNCPNSMQAMDTRDLLLDSLKNRHTYFDLLLGRFKDRALWVWTSISLLGCGAAYISYLGTGLHKFLSTFMCLALGIGAVPLAMRMVYSITLNWTVIIPDFARDGCDHSSEIYSWIDNEFKELEQSWIPVIFASAYALFALVVFAVSGAFDSLTSLLLALVSVVIVLISGFACGIGLCLMGYLGRLIWRLGYHLGKYKLRISEHGFGVLSTGRTLLKGYMIIALVWCIYTGSATGGLKQGWVPVGLLSLPAVIFFIGSFIICQIPLHARMVIAKRTELHELEDILTRLAPHSADDLNTERRKKIEFVNSELQRVKSLPEWPFSIGSISGIAISGLLTVAPQVVKLALSQIHF